MELDAREDTPIPIQVSNSEASKDHAKFKKKNSSHAESADSKRSKPSRLSSKNTKVHTVSSDTDEEEPQSTKK